MHNVDQLLPSLRVLFGWAVNQKIGKMYSRMGCKHAVGVHRSKGRASETLYWLSLTFRGCFRKLILQSCTQTVRDHQREQPGSDC